MSTEETLDVVNFDSPAPTEPNEIRPQWRLWPYIVRLSFVFGGLWFITSHSPQESFFRGAVQDPEPYRNALHLLLAFAIASALWSVIRCLRVTPRLSWTAILVLLVTLGISAQLYFMADTLIADNNPDGFLFDTVVGPAVGLGLVALLHAGLILSIQVEVHTEKRQRGVRYFATCQALCLIPLAGFLALVFTSTGDVSETLRVTIERVGIVIIGLCFAGISIVLLISAYSIGFFEFVMIVAMVFVAGGGMSESSNFDQLGPAVALLVVAPVIGAGALRFLSYIFSDAPERIRRNVQESIDS